MGEIEDGTDFNENDRRSARAIEEGDEVIDGIINSIESGKEDVQTEPISYFRSNQDEELDVSGLEVPEKED